MHHFTPGLTTWHITFGTYGARNHGGYRPTVDKSNNEPGDPFVERNEARESSARGRMQFPPRYLTRAQQMFIEAAIPELAVRGGWKLRTCSAGPDHVHVLLDIEKHIHGEQARRLIKRWLGQALSKRWPLPDGASWWAEEGSNKPVDTMDYLQNAHKYVFGQRVSSPISSDKDASSDGAEDGPAR